jgi:hypothetical protein
MKKLAMIGALIAVLSAPASAVGQRAHLVRARAQVLCPQAAIIPPGRDYAVCGGRFWIRDPQTGKIVSVSFWRLQHRNDPGDDRP